MSSTCTSGPTGSPCSMRSRPPVRPLPTARARSSCSRARFTSTSRPSSTSRISTRSAWPSRRWRPRCLELLSKRSLDPTGKRHFERSSWMNDARLRVGVVGGGLVAQAMHLHYLAAMRERFELTALAEPSRTVRDALSDRYGISGSYADYRGLLDAGGLDAVLICSPAGTHAEIALAALDAGLHVFVEKPMCITLADADAIVGARDRTGRVVQVGTMKRHDPAYERMLAELPASAETLRYVTVVVNDPEFEPYFGSEIVRGADVPRELIEATRRGEADQVEEAVGAGDPDTVRAFSESYLGSMIHDLNVVHGLLERLGEPLPAQVVDGAWWNDGRAVTGA